MGITVIRWSQTGPFFFAGTLAGTVVAWSAGSLGSNGNGGPLAIYRGHSQAVLDLGLAPPIDENQQRRHAFVASASDDASVRIFDIINFDAGV